MKFRIGRHALALTSLTLAGAACTAHVDAPLPNPQGKMDDHAGYAVAIDSNWALAGVPGSDTVADDGGKVLVYRETGASWLVAQTLLPSAPVVHGGFGSSLDVRGARAIVGTRHVDLQSGFGEAYIFERNGTTWTQAAHLIGDTLATYFGRSVAIAGDYAVVGAPGPAPISIVGPGVAYVYRRNGVGTWVRDTTLRASDAVSYMEFGFSVAIEGNLLLIGARGGPYVMDAAYVFRRNGNFWIEEAKLVPLDTPIHRYFGASVSLSNGIAVVGAPYDSAKGRFAGAAYAYEKDSLGTWQQVQKLLPGSVDADDHFGESVSIDYPYAIGGAIAAEGDTLLSGSSFIYQRGSKNWGYALELMATDGAYGDAFGASVSMSGSCAIVGAPDADIDGVLRIGASYIYCLTFMTQAPEIDIICCWTPPVGQPVVATIRYRNASTTKVVGHRRVELVSPSGRVSEGVAARSIVLGGGGVESIDERVVIPMQRTLERGRHELRVRWLDAAGERIERAYFVPPATNRAALGAGPSSSR